ncbi:MAG: AAA family ATPase [Desulfosporosinus sp.]
MRPIRLRIAGLQSFREVQEIDFSKLCETGVFGIFGPTGSGKSTILDAITLALYGTVERAANNTQGILNHAEKQLTVEFCFSLAAGSKRKTYRAERAYRRSGERTVRVSTCRLVEIVQGQETVLAAKADEMTRKIEDILGLSVDDFTRAVVLPQGKFAEFLTIKPKDRRQMLERLFSLEAYGRELTARLAEELASVEYTLNGVEQRQQGLGDASPQRVKEAEADLQTAIVQVAAISQAYANLRQQYDVAKEIWGLQEELQQILKKEAELTASQSNIDTMAERLSLAERAELIRPLLEELSYCEERFQAAKVQVEAADAQIKAARLEKETAEEKWSQANQKRLESEPRCLRRLEQLKQAKGLEDDIQSRTERLITAQKKYSQLERTGKELEQKLQVVQEQKAVALKQQQDVKTHLRQITIDPVLRTQVNAAAQALEAYELVSKQVSDLQRDLEQNALERNKLQLTMQSAMAAVQIAQQSVDQLQGELINKQQNPPVREEILNKQAQELERNRHIITDIERAEREEHAEQERLTIIMQDRQNTQKQVENCRRELDKILTAVAGATALVEQKGAEVKSLEQKNLAALLVENLLAGEPCPVCGSPEHPAPAQSLADEILAQARNQLEQASRELQKLESRRTDVATTLAVANAQLSVKQELEHNQLNLLEAKKRAILSYRQELVKADRHKDTPALISQRVKQEARLTEARDALHKWKTDQEQLNRQVEDARRKLANAEKIQHDLQAQIASIEGMRKEIQNRFNLLRAEQAKRKESLDRVRGSIAISDISLLQQKFAAWDQTINTLNQELAALEEKLRKADEIRQRLSVEKSDCELELQKLKTVGNEAVREIEELKNKRDAMTKGKPALELIGQVKQELVLVTENEEKLKQAYELAKGRLNQAEQAQAVSYKTLELAREGYVAARQKLKQGLTKAQFTTVAEAQSALCNEAERIKMEQAILAYRQNVLTCKQKRQDVEARLKGRSLRQEEWLAWPVRLREAEKAHNDALERRGAAQQRLKKLNMEHEEWMYLEGQRQALSHRRDLLKTLKAVFKGNAFVEFIAQEQLTNVSRAASERLKQLTNQRYALEVDSEGGFIMRDDANGGVRRPVSSLSGGETFLTSLALALALSTQIQLRGESPLEFFFLDEGFGTLDGDLLEIVMNTLEKLYLQNLTLGIISHVPELKNRLARRLVVIPAEAGGAGSMVKLEMA